MRRARYLTGRASPKLANWLTCRACRSAPQARSLVSPLFLDFSPAAASCGRRPPRPRPPRRRPRRQRPSRRPRIASPACRAPTSSAAPAWRRSRCRARRRRWPSTRWRSRASPSPTPFASGDALLATFYLRTATPQEGGVGETEFVFELGSSPYTKSIQYPVQGADGWSKILVRFKAARSYAPGEGHAIFRLGYDPQVIEIGGVKVEDFGKAIAYSNLPSTQATDKKREHLAAAAAKEAAAKAALQPPTEGGDLPVTVSAGEVIRPISPYVYGINSQPFEGVGTTVRRMGGNRQTAYNWELNASNAGQDYNHQSDDWPCTVLGYTDCNVPGAQFVNFGLQNRKAGIESIATVPMVDWVTADKRGPVSEADKAPSKRWDKSLPQKPGAFTTSPDLGDGVVYEDEFVNALVAKLGKAAQGGIRFYSLDNEPALWPSTHPRIHPDKTTYAEMISRTEATATGVLKVDPSAFLLGAVAYGWSEYKSLQDAPDAAEHNAKYGSYLDFFL